MKATCIDYKDTESFSPAIIRYIEGDQALAPFISCPPNQRGFQQALSNRQVTGDRAILVSVLKSQYSRIFNSETDDAGLVKENIERLLSDNTFTITTGHQLNIFTGPLYFIYKIVTAINLANDLKKQFPDKNFVPVYWMATEDHDFAEINHTHINGKKIEWDQPQKGATGRLDTESIKTALAEYKAILGYSENAKELSRLVDEAYSAPNLSQATRILVHELFSRYGLLILDADARELKKQFSGIIARDIIEKNSFRNIESTSRELENIGIDAQVNPREINFFYLHDDFRERIVYVDDHYAVLNSDIRFSEQQLLEEINDFPERFSPNVVLRPLYQEVILPNLAYVGGGAEVIYWLQLKRNFDFYKVDFPVLILRNSALITDAKFEKRLQRLELSIKDIFKTASYLKNAWVTEHSQHDLTLNDEWLQLEKIVDAIKIRATAINPTLGPSTEAIKAQIKKSIDKLEKKFLKAEKRNHQEILASIETLKLQYFSNGLQERHENFGSFYARYGNGFLESLIESFKPLDFKFTILIPETT